MLSVKKPETDRSKHQGVKSPVEGADPKVIIICRFPPNQPMNTTTLFWAMDLVQMPCSREKINFKKIS